MSFLITERFAEQGDFWPIVLRHHGERKPTYGGIRGLLGEVDGMRALVFTGPGVVELREVPEPRPAQGESLVHVRVVGICGSDLHGVRHPGFRTPPLVMGHELAGVTDDGQEVIVNPILSCGHCDLCRRGMRYICEERRIIGVHQPGGFAERVTVPASALIPLPAGMSWPTAALVEPTATALHAWRLARAAAGERDDQRVAVIGCGSIGLLCLLSALAGGAAAVDVADLAPGRLAVARQLGAAAAGPALEGGYDIVFDAVGTGGARAQALEHLRPGGHAVWIGLANSDPGFDATGLVRGERNVLGSFAYTDDDFADAAGLLDDWDLTWATSYPLDAGTEIFTGLMNGSPSPVKALLQPLAPREPKGSSHEIQGPSPPAESREQT
jgi:threonine dehydrogenase-like Zn-dependent dehydrogenase